MDDTPQLHHVRILLEEGEFDKLVDRYQPYQGIMVVESNSGSCEIDFDEHGIALSWPVTPELANTTNIAKEILSVLPRFEACKFSTITDQELADAGILTPDHPLFTTANKRAAEEVRRKLTKALKAHRQRQNT